MCVCLCVWVCVCIFHFFIDGETYSCLLSHHLWCQYSMQQPHTSRTYCYIFLYISFLPSPPSSLSLLLLLHLPLQQGPTWVLFNLAGLYWRIVGNPRQAIECHRRAIHVCPHIHRNVGFVGLSNTLRRLGKLDEAVKATRATLDVNFDEVCLRAWCVLVCIRGASGDACMHVHMCVCIFLL